jgi:hypothetical protein
MENFISCFCFSIYMKKRYLLLVLVLLFIGGCEEVKFSPDSAEDILSLEKIDESNQVNFFGDFSFRDINGGEGTVRIEKEVLEIDVPSYAVYGISATGTYFLMEKNSFARIVLVDMDNMEWLVFGSDFLFLEGSGEFENFCDETCYFEEPIFVKEIRVEGIDASLIIDEISYLGSDTKQNLGRLRESQYDYKLSKLREKIESKSLTWSAGETSVSKKYYRDLKKLFIGNELANLNGFLYYKGGVFEL